MPPLSEHGPVVLVVHADPLVSFSVVTALERRSPNQRRVVQSTPDDPQYERHIDSARVIVADYEQGIRLCEPSRPVRAFEGPHLLVITHRSGEHDVRTALSRGVRGYLVNGFRIDELSAGVQALWRGRRYIAPAAAARLAGSLTRESLTPRQADVLRCLADGCANERIGQRLGISVETVRSHVRKIFAVLGVSNRTEAASMAARLGIPAGLAEPGPRVSRARQAS